MKMLYPILFLLIVIAAQCYTSLRIWQILPLSPLVKTIATGIYNTAFLSLILYFFTAMRTGQLISFDFTTVLYEISTSYPFILLYLVIIFAAVDICKVIHLIPNGFSHESWIGTAIVSGIMLVTFIGGNIHYYNKYRENIHLSTKKNISKSLKIVALSDLHLGYHNQRTEFAKWVDMVNAENPDFILIAGDIIDFSIVPLQEQNMAEEFRRISAPIYACLGNHEYIRGVDDAEKFYTDANIHLLKDESFTLTEYGVKIIGRDDRSNPDRKSISELDPSVNSDPLYSILLDHQPFHLEEAETAGIDFQFSGHTHYGQVWPINYMIDALYECGFGQWRRGDTHYYISSGLGIWGGKFRIGTRSEYVVVEITKEE